MVMMVSKYIYIYVYNISTSIYSSIDRYIYIYEEVSTCFNSYSGKYPDSWQTTSFFFQIFLRRFEPYYAAFKVGHQLSNRSNSQLTQVILV